MKPKAIGQPSRPSFEGMLQRVFSQGGKVMKARFAGIFVVCFFVGFASTCLMPCASSAAEDQPSAKPAAEAKGGMSAEELNRQLNNPVSSVWSIVFQNNYTQLKSGSKDAPGWDEGDDKWYYNLNFQPVLPLPLTSKWNLINRPVIPVFADRPVLESDGFDDVNGLGDIALVSLLSPAKTAGNFLWGAGPSFIFPTATKNELGQEKWQDGPAAVGLYLGRNGSSGRSRSIGGPLPATTIANPPARPISSILSGGFSRASGKWAPRRTS
jgi:hypothetical protein